MKLKPILIFAALLTFSGLVAACPDGYYAVEGPDMTNCYPIPGEERARGEVQNAQPSQPQQNFSTQVKTYWANAYAAVALGPKTTDVWAVWNYRTLNDAKDAAMDNCKRAGVTGCVIASAVGNGAIVVSRGKTNVLRVGEGPLSVDVEKQLEQLCKSEADVCKTIHVIQATPWVESNPYLDHSKSYSPDRLASVKSADDELADPIIASFYRGDTIPGKSDGLKSNEQTPVQTTDAISADKQSALWGVIAMGKGGAAHGLAIERTEAIAKRDALKKCASADCKIMATFNDDFCIAVSTGKTAAGKEFSIMNALKDKAEVQTATLAACKSNAGIGCAITSIECMDLTL